MTDELLWDADGTGYEARIDPVLTALEACRVLRLAALAPFTPHSTNPAMRKLAGADLRESMDAFLAKRLPAWRGA